MVVVVVVVVVIVAEHLSNCIQAFLNGVCVTVVDSAQEVGHPRFQYT